MLDAVTWLAEHEGAEVTFLPTEADGSVTAEAVRETLGDGGDVALVTVMGEQRSRHHHADL